MSHLIDEDSRQQLDTPTIRRAHKLMISDRFRGMVEAVPYIIMWATDLDGKILFCCGGGLSALGLTPRATEGTFISNWSSNLQAKHEQGVAGRSGVTQDVEQSGAYRSISVYSPHYDEDGKIAGTNILSINVTNFQDNTEKQLQDTLSKLQEIINTAVIPLNQVSKMERFFTWLGVQFEAGITWAAPYASKAFTIIITAIALWIAERLGVLDRVISHP